MNKKQVGGRLLQLRGARSQEEVAAALGIRQSTLAMYERGSRMPKDEIKLALARYYGCSVEALFFSENDTIRDVSG
ncbi:MAG: helix-turn-helix transcriptional regulator [Oscillospiraceae bacterium]|nr:helix-turn-helix transcriptional regulator [Oscillospiraceae bacterium]